MYTKIFIPILLVALCLNCKSVKRHTSLVELERLKAIHLKDTITIESNWAYPQNPNIIYNAGFMPPGSGVGNINLIGNHNYFKIIKDSLSIRLPYFGVRQMGGGYNTDNAGINFDGIPSNFKSSFNSKKNIYQYNFDVRNKTESFQIFLVIFPNLSTDIRVNTNQRTSISYQGNVL